MIILPAWAAVLVLGLLPVVGLACYWYGWRLRGSVEDRHRAERVASRASTRPMTPEEAQHFDAAFDHMGRAFDEIGKVFGRRKA
jgi:hypothetical protein